ncbi:MAG: hypothetical protein PUK16_07840 [Prevotellaceae bacterium]|nr:hypothetical protein [Prevotellaceae bacterium]
MSRKPASPRRGCVLQVLDAVHRQVTPHRMVLKKKNQDGTKQILRTAITM